MSVFAASLPPEAAGRWCWFELRMAAVAPWWAKIEAADEARGQVVREAFLGPRRISGTASTRTIVLHVPSSARAVRISLFCDDEIAPAGLAFRLLSRPGTAGRLLMLSWRSLPAALRGDRRGVLGRLRAVLGQGPARAGEAPPYAVWIGLFDNWRGLAAPALAAACATLPRCDISAVIVPASSGAADKAAVEATRRSLPPDWPVYVITTAQGWPPAAQGWLLILEAGEVLAAHAADVFRLAAARAAGALAVIADHDHLDAAGQRVAPHLRPPPDPWLLQSEFFGRGAALFRMAPHAAAWPELPLEARAARLALLRGIARACIHRLPLILSHCSLPERRALPPATPQRRVSHEPAVSILVPSACRSWHVHACLSDMLAKTVYPDFEVLVAVAQIDEGDLAQSAILRAVSGLPRVRILDLGLPAFNFSAAINRAAAAARGELLLLLNDDIVPTTPRWLSQMVTYVCSDPASAADIVGAKLLYGNGMVQHGGVILGLADLCEHAFRFAAREDVGAQGLASLDRQVSAVTAACLLVRRSIFEQAGGFDEDFAIALNDVDFCLRAGELGGRIVMASRIELVHFESLSLGRHYQGQRASLEAIETRRLRDRWPGPIRQDPFYHPCASRELGREFQPGFPPSQTPFSWIAQNLLAMT